MSSINFGVDNFFVIKTPAGVAGGTVDGFIQFGSELYVVRLFRFFTVVG